MGRQTTRVLFLMVIAVGAYIWFVDRRVPSVDEERAAARRAVRFDTHTVTRVSVLVGAHEVTAERTGNLWSLTRPVQARADAAQVQALIDELGSLERAGFITARERRRGKLGDEVYGLDLPRARVLLTTADGPVTVRIGRDAPVGGTLFLQREGQKDVVVASTNIIASLPLLAAAWRDRRLLQAPTGPLTRLEVKRTDGYIQLARDEAGAWRLQKPVAGLAEGAAVEDWLRRLFAVRVEDFVADSVVGAALYGLDEPQAQAVLSGASSGAEQVLVIGREIAGSPGLVYAALRGTEAVYAVSNAVLDILRIPLASLRDRRVLPWPPGSLRRLDLAREGKRVSLVSTNGAEWELVGARRQPAEGPLVWSLVSTWAGARIAAFHDDQATNLAAWGLAAPACTITLAIEPDPATNAVDAGEALTLQLSRIGGTGEVYALASGGMTVWQVPGALLDSVGADGRFYRARSAFELVPAEVRSVAFQQGTRSLAWERAGTNGDAWASLPTQKIGRVEVDAWMEQAGHVRAAEWVADDPHDLSAYGLAPPAAMITVGLTGESGLAKVLLLGGAAGPGLVHALVKGQDAVFTLEEAERDKLLAPLYKMDGSHAGADPDPSPAPSPVP